MSDETAYYGKWHLGCKDPGFFDVWKGYNSLGGGEDDNFPGQRRGSGLDLFWVDGKIGGDYKPDLETDRVIDYLKKQTDSDKPFFLTCSYYPPHDPPTAPDRFFKHYRGRGVPAPGYYAAVSAVDHNIGKILETLKANGLEKDTILLFCSDHGDSHRYRDGVSKTTCYEEVIRIPWLIRWPNGSPKGTVLGDLVGLEDITPTLLDLAGLEVPGHVHGKSIAPLLQGNAQSWRESYCVQNITKNNVRQRCLRTREWKLVLSEWLVTVKDYAGEHLLFNLAQEPEEETNLYFDDNYKDVVVQLASALRQRAEEMDDPLGIDLAEKSLLDITKRSRN